MEGKKEDNSWLGLFAKKDFWRYFGPALLVSIAYMDPGNFGTSIAAGSTFNYTLLWIVWLSSGMAMLFQYLSGKVGLAGYSLAELIKNRWKNQTHVFAYWLASEAAILATDLAEFLGTAVALNLLFNIPLLIAAVISVFDVLLLLLLTKRGFRTLEYAFILFVSIIGIGYIYEILVTGPNLGMILYHSVVPIMSQNMALFAIGIVGATVMPHALFVHSWLTKNKLKNGKHDRKKVLRFHIADTVFSLLIAGFINAAILIMAAKAFYGGSSQGIATINQAYQTLVPLFGTAAAVVFAIALLSSGISSSILGTLAGQSIMESLTSYRISQTTRRIITRGINLIPIVVAVALNVQPLEMLVYSQVVLSLLIPLPMIPLVYYTAKKEIMGVYVNRKITNYIAVIFAGVILVFNAYLIYSFL